MKRQIVLDTETTGLEPETGHRIIEIGGVEVINRKLTGRHFHKYINPQRDIDDGDVLPVETGRQLWPAATLAEYRLALLATPEHVAAVLDETDGLFL